MHLILAKTSQISNSKIKILALGKGIENAKIKKICSSMKFIDSIRNIILFQIFMRTNKIEKKALGEDVD